ncbi:MAG TPA: aminotransferase class III-fold pyridoxal phosphate-dependent enzyme [Rhodanobacteraceae bacterium]|nr:aminotransferase class III-fold pyridoxal phosphate-dependent enzyme [Rhodanobacteraceae bacterium]
MAYSDAYDPLDGVAIIGMAGRFPEASSVAELWRNLLAQRECISRFTAEQLEPAHHEDMVARSNPNYVRARGVLADADRFDERFFGFSPKEAEILDPQQRLFLQAAWEAIEHAGHDAQRFAGPIGVFAGATSNSYYLQNLLSRRDITDLVGPLLTSMGNNNDYIATRVAYKFDLKGPALNIQNACSTSLVAVCTAVQSLQTYQCDMALAGGVSIQLPQRRGYLHEDGSILSPDGHCRAFDRDAAGTVFSNGLGVVVLRRLRDAIEDGDTVYAVIKGAALNNDGSTKVSFTAPSVDGHAQVISMAQMLGGIDPSTISYIEAHGTGTSLGDPIEIAGLTQAFRAGGAQGNGFCAIGSIKTNIGHLDVAAGVTGLIKATLALHHRILPASINFNAPSPKLGIENTPFFVNATQRDWSPGATPRRAGVSSFGVGGTNAHVVLEEAPQTAPVPAPSRREQLLVLSARDADALQRVAEGLKNHLQLDAGADLADVAYTLQVGRRRFNHRRSLVVHGRDDAIALLTTAEPKRVHEFSGDGHQTRVCFMFPGQGAQYVNMGRRLYESEPGFRDEIDACARILEPHLGIDLRNVLYPEDAHGEEAQTRLTQTAVTQPVLFTIEYALAQLWMSWGVTPEVTIGHSIGEYVAACIGGTFTREDALSLVARRARLMQEMAAGSMLAVRASAEEMVVHLGPRTSIAAVNAPKLTVISGDHEAIAELAAALDAKGVAHRRLSTSHAYHSPMMEPVVAPYAAVVEATPRHAPRIRWVSSLTGRLVADDEAVDPGYWARQLREPVQFANGIAQLADARLALVEVGPGQALTSLCRQQDQRIASQLITTSLHPGQDFTQDVDYLLAATGQLWARNIDIDWHKVHGGTRRRIPLPTYPFERRRHWVDPDPAFGASGVAAANATQDDAIAGLSDATIAPSLSPIDTTVMTTHRTAALLSRLQSLFAELSGIDAAHLRPDANFLELGLDSLTLTQATNVLQKHFGVRISLRTLLEDCATLDTLAARLLSLMPEEMHPAPPTVVAGAAAIPANLAAGLAATARIAGTSAGADSNAIAGVFAQQLAIISRQLDMLGAGSGAAISSLPVPSAASTPGASTPPPPAAAHVIQHSVGTAAPTAAFGPYRPPARGATGGLTDRQQGNLAEFIERYNRKTARSKQSTSANRGHLADPRSVAGFRQIWKEMVYPIVSVRSSGSHLWDIDGNDYIDVTNGFGMILFGHNPPFIREAVQAQLDTGYEIGPQTPLAGEVSGLLCEMVGMERAAFCSTGSEAVMAAIRVARTVSGRDRIVMFSGAYHGIFDEVLVRPTHGGTGRAMPIAPGIPGAMTDNVLVLDYGTPETLQTIQSMAGELAAVLVEPVQSRRPEFQPREFLQELRKITADSETALVFDEVVTGFRVHPGGAQAVFGVRADIATYGKVIGGGLPIGMVAGSAKYLDALDGGGWQFGDDSGPEAGVTFFAGTFVRHPLALAAARAVLQRLKQEGPELQRGLNVRTTAFVERLRGCVDESGAPVRIHHFSSWFCITFPADLPLSAVFFAGMREKGVHIWEGRPCFLTLAHSDADLDRIVEAFRSVIAEMQAADFLPGRADSPRKGRDASGREAWFVPDPDRPGKYLQVSDEADANV